MGSAARGPAITVVRSFFPIRATLPVAVAVMCGALVALADTPAAKPASAATGWATRTAPAAAAPTTPTRQPVSIPDTGELYYARVFGVDHLRVRSLSSGFTLEFRYRVVDPEKAKVLSDKKAKPVMIDPKWGNRLSIPTLENIGDLRQSQSPEAGKQYWMMFHNAGRLVKPGQRVDVVIGSFHAEGLTVE